MRLIGNDDTTLWYLDEETEAEFYPEHQQISIDNDRDFFVFLCIDVGIINLGMSIITTDFDYNINEVVGIALINIMDFKCDRKTCKLKHDKVSTDWVDHLIENDLY